MRLAIDLVRNMVRVLYDRLFDIFAIDCHPVYFTKTAIPCCAGIVRVRITPATLLMSLEGIAICAIVLRTAADLPARDEGVDVLDPLDAKLLFRNGLPDTFQAINIGLGVPTLIRAGLVRSNEPFPFVVPESLNRHFQHSRNCSDGV